LHSGRCISRKPLLTVRYRRAGAGKRHREKQEERVGFAEVLAQFDLFGSIGSFGREANWGWFRSRVP
jgi:hypothetical protein